MTKIDLAEAIQSFPSLAELAANGEEIIIAKDDQPFVKLVSAKPQKKQRKFGSAQGMIVMTDDFNEPLEDLKDYM